jgi:hypothetical protein
LAPGFAVLGLNNPAHPRLKNKKTVSGATGVSQPNSITISKDGDHVAVAVGNTVYAYKNVRAAITKGKPFKLQTSFHVSPDADDVITDVAYTSNDNLLVLHGNGVTNTGWALTVVRKVPAGHHAIQGSTSTTPPEDRGTLSVYRTP